MFPLNTENYLLTEIMKNLVRVTVPCIPQPFVLLAEEAYKVLVSLTPMHVFSSKLFTCTS